jgi:hypothetical protein
VTWWLEWLIWIIGLGVCDLQVKFDSEEGRFMVVLGSRWHGLQTLMIATLQAGKG